MDTIEFISVPVIATVVYTLITLLKQAVDNNEKVLRFIPLISVGLGAVLGLAAYFLMPSLLPAKNAFVAILLGGSSGLTATGTHQIFKQISKDNTNSTPPNSSGGDENKTGS